MKRRILTALVGIITITFLTSPTTSRARNGYIDQSALFESEEVEFETLHTTGYLITGITATGGTTRVGIGACNTHVGDLAICYTTDGEYLTTIEITDTGSNPLLVAGKSLDVWFPSMEEAKDWMLKTGGRVKVYWVKGEG